MLLPVSLLMMDISFVTSCSVAVGLRGVSNFESFQANRLKLRFREGEQKPQLTHTLNGSALALPRIVAALLENNQTEKGIRIPSALISYTGFEMID